MTGELDQFQGGSFSHAPAEERHTVPADATLSAQTVLIPSQWSVASQSPAEDRHTVVAGAGTCTQTWLPVSHESTEQGLFSAQSELLLHARAMMQSSLSEFGCDDANAQTSSRTACATLKSPGVTQHVTRASVVVHPAPLHLLAA